MRIKLRLAYKLLHQKTKYIEVISAVSQNRYGGDIKGRRCALTDKTINRSKKDKPNIPEVSMQYHHNRYSTLDLLDGFESRELLSLPRSVQADGLLLSNHKGDPSHTALNKFNERDIKSGWFYMSTLALVWFGFMAYKPLKVI